MTTFQRLVRQHEFVLLMIIIAFLVVGWAINPAFLSLGSLFSILQSIIPLALFALGVFVAMIAGGIDVSSSAIGVFTLYVSTKILLATNIGGSILLALLLAMTVGLLLGLFNGFVISKYDLPAIIVTIGTLNLFSGFLVTFVGDQIYNQLPAAMSKIQQSNLVTVQPGRFRYGLPTAILLLVVAVLVTWIILRYTKLGRGIYTIGGNSTSAERVGFNPKRIKLFIYPYAGLLYGLAGLMYGTFANRASPFSIIGKELTVIAAVVLGGVRITGGHGTIGGVLLGVFLMTIIQENLIMLGVPSYWQQTLIGLLIIFSVVISTLRQKQNQST